MLQKIFLGKLEHAVQKYFANHPEVRLIVVTGSVGKSSTKLAVATVLSQKYRIRMHDETMRTPAQVALSILGVAHPKNERNLLAWIKALRAANYQVKQPNDVDIIIQELAVAKPGDMQAYARYLRPDIAIVSAVTPEHMQAFQTIENVAKEELSVSDFSNHVLINRDEIDGQYARFENNPNINTYGTTAAAEYSLSAIDYGTLNGTDSQLTAPQYDQPLRMKTQLVGEHSLRPLAAAATVAILMEFPAELIVSGIERIEPMPGCMNPLRGIGNTLIIDDSYTADPASSAAALKALYQFDIAPQRIVVFGRMDGLGPTMEDAYKTIGELCNPDLLAWVVVVGDKAVQEMAPAARGRGCQVKICIDAIQAGEFVRSVSEQEAVILAEGSSQDYLEETVKILADMTEDTKLVRQSEEWMAKKNKQFSRFTMPK